MSSDDNMDDTLSPCELRVELPHSSISSDSDSHSNQAIPHLETTAQNLFRSDSGDLGTLSSFAQSIHLCRYEGATSHCPLVAIPLPGSILAHIDDQEDQSRIRNQGDRDEEHSRSLNEILHSILPKIHPSLIQLTPCGIIRTLPRNLMNCFDVILLKIPDDFSLSDARGGILILNTIIEEINGLEMAGGASATIQIIPIFSLRFTVAKYEDAEMVQGQNSNQSSIPSSSAMIRESKIESSRKPLELPLCPVCRFRIMPQTLGLHPLRSSQLCSYQCDCGSNSLGTNFCDNMRLLSQWSYPTYCHSCHVLQRRLIHSGAQPFPETNSLIERFVGVNGDSTGDSNQIKCYTCGMGETLWICLTCGVMGCGWYSNGHAERHFEEHNHPFSLELATQRIWDYETGSFVHRDDLLNCPWMQKFLGEINRAAYQGASFSGNSSNGEELVDGMLMYMSKGTPSKKAMTVGEEYEALLQSSLEDQSQYYEGKIAHLRAELAAQSIDQDVIPDEDKIQMRDLEYEISKLREDIEKQNNLLLEIQAQEVGHKAKYKIMLKEQSVAKDLLQKIKEESRHERDLGRKEVDDMQQQISDLSANIMMRQQISQSDELSNAQIFGTSGETTPTKRRGFRKKRK